MIFNKRNLSLLLACFFFTILAQKKENSITVSKDTFLENLISKMTLEEKLGQLNLQAGGDITTGQLQKSDFGKKITSGQIGGLFNIKSMAKIKAYQKLNMDNSRLKIPLIFAMDVIHGYETTFPIPLGLSCSWDINLIEKTARVAAQEATADGINWTFSPMVDISRDPRWGRVSEGSGEDPYLGSKIAEAMVKGYENNNLKNTTSLVSCIKHFALYGAPEAGREYNTVDMSRLKMYNEYFPPYLAGVKAGSGTVMASFNEVDGIPATGNKWLLDTVLRKQWGFKGLIVSDYTGINEMETHGVGTLEEVAALAMNAGLDIDMVGEAYLSTLKNSIEKKNVTVAQIDLAVKRILSVKYDLGLFDNPFKNCDEKRGKEIYSKVNRDFARKVGSESIVLLKNENKLLPISNTKKIALVGPLADAPENMSGTWSVATNHKMSISLRQGILESITDKNNLLYAKGSNLSDDEIFENKATIFGKTLHRDNRTKAELLKEAVEIAEKSDVIIATLGESAEMSGECSSRTNLEIPQAQKDLLNALLKTGKPVILILFNGRPIILNEEKDKVPAILNTWFAGSEAGYSIADVVFGKVNPSAKLTMTFPRSVGQIPIYYSHKNTGRPLMNDEGKFEKFKSNYIDERNEPLYPFGYGLSYTNFEYSNLKISAPEITKSEKLLVSVDIKNTGDYDGKEVVQLYIRDVVGSITRPLKELKSFKKIEIKKGTSQTINFEITEDDLKFYNSDLQFVAEKGQFELFVGTNSEQNLKTSFILK